MRRQRGIVRRLRRSTAPGFELGDALFNAFTCASNSSMCSSRAAICPMNPSIRASSDAASWAQNQSLSAAWRT
jgi:hypothetical protein